MKDLFKKIIADFHERGVPEVVNRDFIVPIGTKKIISLIGARRTGKTYLFYQTMHALLQSGLPMKNIVFINFEDERLDVSRGDLADIIDAYVELFPETNIGDVYFFFDEVQNADGWEKFVRRLHDTVSSNVFVTGSSAKLLSTEIATSLRGRTITFPVYPLSFKEYLRFLGEDYTTVHSTKQQLKMQNLCEQYITNGGFPEVVHFEEHLRIKTLQNYADVMLYRDIVERHTIANINALGQFIKKNISNIATRQSFLKTYNELQTLGIKVSKDSLYDFARYCEDAFYLFYVGTCDRSFIKQQRAPKKVYAVDTGLVRSSSFAFSKNEGRLLENAVFIDLKRREKDVCYYGGDVECDFVVRESQRVTAVLQVTKEMSSEDTRKREIEGIISAMNHFKLKEGTIITMRERVEENIDGKKIVILPLWEWFLQ